jgi:hypothetical protein
MSQRSVVSINPRCLSFEGMTYSEAYQPIIDDGRGRFPEEVRFKAPRGLRQAIAKAAELEHTTQAEWTRRAVLQCLTAKGVRLLRRRANRAFVPRPL